MRITNSNWKVNIIVNDGTPLTSGNCKQCKQFNMLVYKTHCFKLLLFPTSMKARVMGKRPNCHKCMNSLPFKIRLARLMSHSATHEFPKCVNFHKTLLKNIAGNVEYEPEIFPAIRFRSYVPACVNVFHSGKVTLLGVKSEQQAKNIILELEARLCFDS